MSRRISAVLLDLSGTVHVDDQLLPGVKDALAVLTSKNIPYQFLTNNSKESNRSLVGKLAKAGLNVKEELVFSSLNAARDLVKRDNLRPLLLLEDAAIEQFRDIDTVNPNAVVVGLAPSCFNYEKLNEAFLLVKSGARLVAVNKSRYFKKADQLALGTGAFVAGLEYSCDCQAEVVGKPSETFFKLAVARLGGSIPTNEVLMVGDDIRDDVIGAQIAGLQGALVKTGKYQPGDELKEGGANFVFDSLVEMANFVANQFQA